LDGQGVAEPGRRLARWRAGTVEPTVQQVVLRDLGGDVALEDDGRPRRPEAAFAGQRLHAGEVFFAARLRQPDDLEDVVALDKSVGVVLDRLAGPRQQPG